jgi:hypothetical protein
VSGRGKLGHVSTDLGEDDFGGALSDARDRHEQIPGCGERGDLLLDRVR